MKARFPLLLVGVALVAGGVFAWKSGTRIDSQVMAENWSRAEGLAATAGAWVDTVTRPAAPAAASAVPANDEPVRVVTAPAAKSTVPILLSGIGTVQAYNTVDAKAQVDGVILRLNFKEGDDVKIGDPLVTIDPAPYEARVLQWQAAKERATAQLENAKTNLWRDQQLLAKDFATQKQTDAESALVGQYTADIAEADAQIKFAQNQLDDTVIRSPINGRTGIRHVDAGNLIRAADNTNIVTVVQTKPISVIITVPAKALAQAGISSGMTDLPVMAYEQDGVALLDRGKVETVNNVVDAATGTIKLKANFPNERNRLWPGDFVDCKIVVESRHDGITVPAIAIEHGPKGDFVWVVNPQDSAVEPRHVHVRQTVGDVALIDRGLEGDETVVTEGQYYLRSGIRVAAVSELPVERSEISATR